MLKSEFEALVGFEVDGDYYNDVIEPMYDAVVERDEEFGKREFAELLDKKRLKRPEGYIDRAEILFRGWNAEGGGWEYGAVLPHDGGKCTIFKQDEGDGSLSGAEVELGSVGQYVGDTDSSGRRIFEGDALAVFDAYGQKDRDVMMDVRSIGQWHSELRAVARSGSCAMVVGNSKEGRRIGKAGKAGNAES